MWGLGRLGFRVWGVGFRVRASRGSRALFRLLKSCWLHRGLNSWLQRFETDWGGEYSDPIDPAP